MKPPCARQVRHAQSGLRNSRLWTGAVLFLCGMHMGCAALTNPVARGVPAGEAPAEWLGESREGDLPIPMNLLSQPAPDPYRLGPGDVLGVYVEGVLGDEKATLPVVRTPEKTRRAPEREEMASSVGYPISVRHDGTISLPQIKPFPVTGLSIEEAEQAIRKAYIDAKILQPGKERTFVTLQHKRLYQVLVFRRDVTGRFADILPTTRVGLFGSGAELVGKGVTGQGYEIMLPAYENDVLHALALTGGFPGTNAARCITIYRDPRRPAAAPRRVLLKQPVSEPIVRGVSESTDAEHGANVEQGQPEKLPAPREAKGRQVAFGGPIVTVPLRFCPDQPLVFSPEDVILQNGDIVFVDSAPVDTFYTAGLLPPAEHVLPRDYDLDVVQAVARVRGPMVNGAFGGSNLSGVLIQPGIGNPSPRLLSVVRRTPEGETVRIIVDLHRALVDPRERILVQPGDVLILQETYAQALARYFTDTFNFTAIFRVFPSRDTLGINTISIP